MKINSLVTLVISLCLSGHTTAQRLQVSSIVPKLDHASYKVVEQGSHVRRAVLDIPALEVAKQFVAKELNFFDGQDYVVKNSYTSANGVTHTYLKQIIKGKEVTNGDININVDKAGNIISYGNSFTPANLDRSANFAQENPGNVVDAVETLFNHINLDLGIKKEEIIVVEPRSAEDDVKITNVPTAKNGITASQAYIQKGSEEVSLTWNVQVELEDNWFSAYVDANTKQVVGLYDWVYQSSYNVYSPPINDPEEGSRTIVTQQGTKTASPLGWHDQGNGKTFTTTTGNNVVALDNRNLTRPWNDQPRAEGGRDLKFDFPVDLTKQPGEYIDAALTNLFYINNWYHDYLYAHGFNEVAGNFQQNNFGKGGLGGDPVRAQAQDGSDKDNSKFGVPPDGIQPRMKMFTWDLTTPERDGDFDNGIILHEYTHGLSNRLTGGPANVNCLQKLESKGLGEGWSDIFANLIRQKESYNRNTNLLLGDYVTNGGTIRQHPYSTSFDVNPDKYSSIDGDDFFYEHPIGAVWAEILYEVYWNLRDRTSFTSDLLSGDYTHANTLLPRLLIDGMKLQPCSPTFIQARDAIILAEKILTGGNFKCELWRGFAKRGLGVNAKLEKGKHIDGFKVPEEC